ncbi:MAG: endolytic transglycosylase MltG [Oscillospiraceae bacterium]
MADKGLKKGRTKEVKSAAAQQRQHVAAKRPAGAKRPDNRDYDYERSVKFANRGCLLVVAVIVVVLAFTALGIYSYVMAEIDGKHASAKGTVSFEVPPGSGGQTVSKLLYQADLIGNEGIFRFYVRFNGAGAGFQRGTFELEPGMSYGELINTLSQPPPPRETVEVTFPPGGTVLQFAAAAEKAGVCTAEEFLHEANNGDFSDLDIFNKSSPLYIEQLGNTYMRAEGYLAPDTYEFYVDETPYNVVKTLFSHFNDWVKELYTEDVQKRVEAGGMTLRDMITLASMIEEEASIPDENQASVAGVFWNRLTRDDYQSSGLARRTLGSDVTLRYLTDWVARDYGGLDVSEMSQPEMKEAALAIIPEAEFYAYYTGDDDPLTREGLPVSPISNPGKAAITAALHPELNDFFYFLAYPDGEFAYAKTYYEHTGNVEKLRQMVAAQGG